MLAFFVVLSGVMFASAWGHLRTSWIGRCCDPEQSIWFLAWTPYAARHLTNPFVTQHLNHPFGVNLMWNSAMHLPSLLSAPAQVLLGPIGAYNVALAGGIAVSAWAAYLAARRYCQGRFGPLVCGLLYGFSPYMLPQALQHLPLVLTAVPPLVILLLDDLLRRGRWSRATVGVALGALAAAQLLIDEEVLASMAVIGGIGLAVVAVQAGNQLRERAKHSLHALPAAAGVFLALSAWPLATQFFGPQRPQGDLQSPDLFVTDLLNFVVPTESQLFAPHQAVALATQFTGLLQEQNGYLGLPLLALLVFLAVRAWRDPVVRTFTALAAISAILSMGPHLHVAGQVTSVPLPWLPLGGLPLVRNILPGRLMLYTFLFAGLAIGRWADTEMALDRARRGIPAAVTVLLVMLPLLPVWPFPVSTGQNPEFFKGGAPQLTDRSVVLIAPFIRDGGDADPMLWAAETGDRIRMPQGYFFIPGPDGAPYYGALPSPLVNLMEDTQEHPRLVDYEGPARQALAADIRRRGVETIVVGPMKNRELMIRVFTLLLRRPPDDQRGGVVIWNKVSTRGVPAGPP